MPLVELMMCPPTYLSNKIQNNVDIKEMKQSGLSIEIDLGKAAYQFFNIYSRITHDAQVWLLPPKQGLQDQVYTSNAAVVLPHVKKKTAVLSNFKAPGRAGEEVEAGKLLTLLGYRTIKCPFKFEGEAELIWVRDNIYIGGYGQRTSPDALSWIGRTFQAEVIPVRETDPRLYHLDCSVLPLDGNNVLVNTDSLSSPDVKRIEKIANIIPIKQIEAYGGATNSVPISYVLYNGSSIDDLKKGTDEYDEQRAKIDVLERICARVGMELVFINIGEFTKSGADLSCMTMQLTRNPPDLGGAARKL